MGWFRRRRGPKAARGAARAEHKAALEHLEQFVHSRYGVEGYIEPRTMVTETTLLLIAHDGEWTRRRIPDPQTAYALGNRLGIPIYDVNLVGYPQRMREYNARRKQQGS